MSPALNGSSAIQRYEHSDTIEIRDRIAFDFYTGMPHIACGGPTGHMSYVLTRIGNDLDRLCSAQGVSPVEETFHTFVTSKQHLCGR